MSNGIPRDELASLFGGLHDDRERHLSASASAHLARANPIRAKAAAAGMPVGRMLPASDFDAIKRRKTDGVPGLIAPPRQVDQGLAPPVQQMRQLTGLPPNNRSNAIFWDLANTTGADVPLVQLNGTVDDTDAVQVMLGLQFSAPFPDLSGNLGSVDTGFKALVTWGVGNATFSAIVDWKIGCVLTLPANFLSVTARCPASNQIVGNHAPLPKALLSVGVAYGAAPSHRNRATLTGVVASLSAAATSIIETPHYAVSLGLMIGSQATPTFQVDFLSTPTAAVPSPIGSFSYVSQSNLGLQGSDVYPIPGGATHVRIKNIGTDALDVRPFWELSF
jgi:hypothetical protein